MNMQLLTQFGFRNTASLTLIIVTSASTASLPYPIGTIIRLKTAAPGRILFSSHIVLMGHIKAFFAAVLVIAIIYLVGFALHFFSTGGTRHPNSLFGAILDLFGCPLAHTLPITKIVCFHGARRNTFFLSAPSAFYDCGNELTFRATEKLFSFLKAIWLQTYRITTRCTVYCYLFSLCFLRTTFTAIFPTFLRLKRQHGKFLSTLFTG